MTLFIQYLYDTYQMIEDCHRRFREDELVEELIAILEKHVSAG